MNVFIPFCKALIRRSIKSIKLIYYFIIACIAMRLCKREALQCFGAHSFTKCLFQLYFFFGRNIAQRFSQLLCNYIIMLPVSFGDIGFIYFIYKIFYPENLLGKCIVSLSHTD